MFKTYLKIASRNLLRHKLHTFILIFGLSMGIAASILILEYVSFRWSFDYFHADADRIFRVINTRYQNGEQIQKGPITYPTVGPTMTKDYPEIEQYTRLTYSSNLLLHYEDAPLFRVENALWTDEHFLNLFTFPLLAGDAKTALKETNCIAISRSLAEKIFTSDKLDYNTIVGKTVNLQDYPHPYKITAVFEDIPSNSTLQTNLMVSYASAIRYWGEGAGNSWDWSDFYHYLKLKPTTNIPLLTAKFDALVVSTISYSKF